jgi:hypothetical protein
MKQYKVLKADNLEEVEKLANSYGAVGWHVIAMGPDVDNIGYYILVESN